MIKDVFPVEPWTITETQLDLDELGRMESIFSLSNGHIGFRGNLDEGEPFGTPGTYLNGFFEIIPLPYAEDGYGYPDEGQTLVNITNGKIIRLLVDDEPFDVRYGEVLEHTRQLDMRDGTLFRNVLWVSPAGKKVRVRTTRFVSFAHRTAACIKFEVEAVDQPARIVIQSSLVTNEPMPSRNGMDPRGGGEHRLRLISEHHSHRDMHALLAHRTERSGLYMVAGMDHQYTGPEKTRISSISEPDLARVTFSSQIDVGESMSITKYVGYGWSAIRSMPALRDQVDAAISAIKRVQWDGLLREQRAYLDDVWAHADIEIEGDDQLQQAVRFALFQAIQASARAERRAIPAKGLTSRGYDGHTFWDMDTFLLPMLTYSSPNSARDALLWRHSTLDLARERATELRLKGATFPWRTIRGEECSGYWPAGTAAFHINADVADAVRRYLRATQDTTFERKEGFDILIETARLWHSLGHHDAEGQFRIDGVTGPDEYTALVDNNVFTNLMAARNLQTAAEVAEKYPSRAAEFGVDDNEITAWKEAAERMVVPFDEELGVTAQSEGFTRYRLWDFANTKESDYPLLLHFPYYLLYSSQVIKQSDMVMALYLCGDHFTPEQKRRDFEFYEAITVRDSSLSASTQAIVAAEVGYMDLAYEYFRETALVDLLDLAGNTDDGIHLASMAATWLVAIAGFGGMRDYGDKLMFNPHPPRALDRLRFRMRYQDRLLRVTIEPRSVMYELVEGDPLTILHVDEDVELTVDTPVMRDLQPQAFMPHVQRPIGRDVGILEGGVSSGQSSMD